MKTAKATADQQFLNHDCSTNSSCESSFEVLSDIEYELESILAKEFEQGLPNDLDSAGV